MKINYRNFNNTYETIELDDELVERWTIYQDFSDESEIREHLEVVIRGAFKLRYYWGITKQVGIDDAIESFIRNDIEIIEDRDMVRRTYNLYAPRWEIDEIVNRVKKIQKDQGFKDNIFDDRLFRNEQDRNFINNYVTTKIDDKLVEEWAVHQGLSDKCLIRQHLKVVIRGALKLPFYWVTEIETETETETVKQIGIDEAIESFIRNDIEITKERNILKKQKLKNAICD